MSEIEESPDETDTGFDVLSRERYAPIGAAASTCSLHEDFSTSRFVTSDAEERVRLLELEQGQLNDSLLSLTSHFAQVQFRLKQVVSAPLHERNDLLKKLEDFAFKGAADLTAIRSISSTSNHENSPQNKMLEQKMEQKHLISQLKEQLEDLEQLAYDTGTVEDVPQAIVLERQRVVMDQLRAKMDLEISDLEKMSPEQLRECVNSAVGKIVNPAKVKEQLVQQLQTQISDLESFIDFLKIEQTEIGDHQLLPGNLRRDTCSCAIHSPGAQDSGHRSKDPLNGNKGQQDLVKKALLVMQMYVVGHFGCVSQFRDRARQAKSEMGKTPCGELLKKLEMSVSTIIAIASSSEPPSDSDYTSDSSDTPTVRVNADLLRAVRRDLAPVLRELFMHGLVWPSDSRSLISPFSCFASRNVPSSANAKMHAWDLFLRYYDLKQGEKFNRTPARRLSESFKLDMTGSNAITSKQLLLSTLHNVLTIHKPFRCNADTQWKSLVCYALNSRKLAAWCRLVIRTQSLVESNFCSWAYAVQTGFEPALQLLDKLSPVTINLPADIAVRPYKSIKDAF